MTDHTERPSLRRGSSRRTGARRQPTQLRLLEVLVGRVRKKLGPSVPTLTLEKSTGIICRRRNTSLIETRRGFGYTVPERV